MVRNSTPLASALEQVDDERALRTRERSLFEGGEFVEDGRLCFNVGMTTVVAKK